MSRESEIDRLVEMYLSDIDPDRAIYFMMIYIDICNLWNPDDPITLYGVQSRAFQVESAKYD